MPFVGERNNALDLVREIFESGEFDKRQIGLHNSGCRILKIDELERY
jgi:hypothetical protein